LTSVMASGLIATNLVGVMNKRANFHMAPRIVETLGLTPYAYRLYGYLKANIGEREDQSFSADSLTLAHGCRMSAGMVVTAKRELVAAELISIEKETTKYGRIDRIFLLEIWHKNHAMFHQILLEARSPGEQAPEKHVHHMNNPQAQNPKARSPGESVPINKETHNNKATPEGGADAPVDLTFDSFSEAMKTASTKDRQVAILVTMATAYSRGPHPRAGEGAAALLKRVNWDGGYALVCLGRACFARPSGNLFTYAQGIAKNNKGRATRVEPSNDLSRYKGKF